MRASGRRPPPSLASPGSKAAAAANLPALPPPMLPLHLPLRPSCPLCVLTPFLCRSAAAMSGVAHRATLTDEQFGQGHPAHSEEALRAEAAEGVCSLALALGVCAACAASLPSVGATQLITASLASQPHS